jgi:RNA polymerase sigma-70 factor (ECF subfamily)
MVFMNEGRNVLAGEAILSGATIDGNRDDRNGHDGTHNERSEDDRNGDVRSGERGQDETLETLVQEHSRMVYRIAYAVLRRHHDAEDATQETFLRVLRYRSRLEGVNEPKTWLARIAWRVAVDRSKLRGRTREISRDDPEKPLPEVPYSGSSADEAMHGDQMSLALERMIAALPQKLREPLILSAIEEMSLREVGAMLRINEAAVRSRIFRARQILRQKLAERMNRK